MYIFCPMSTLKLWLQFKSFIMEPRYRFLVFNTIAPDGMVVQGPRISTAIAITYFLCNLHWHWSNNMIALVPANQPWMIWAHALPEFTYAIVVLWLRTFSEANKHGRLFQTLFWERKCLFFHWKSIGNTMVEMLCHQYRKSHCRDVLTV